MIWVDILICIIEMCCYSYRDIICLQSSAKPADWKYQTGVLSSWPMLTCSVELDVLIPVTESASNTTDKCIQVRTKDILVFCVCVYL